MLSRQNRRKAYFSALVGVVLEYYDSYLYVFLAPLLAPLFFPHADEVVSLILTYALYPLGIIARPLGAIIIGKIGDTFGRKQALTLSICGTACVTGLIGLLPTHQSIGFWAPTLLVLLRMLQVFFVAGEYNGGAIFMLEHRKRKKGFTSGLYCAFTVGGILLASAVSTVVAYLPEGSWRIAYLISFCTAIGGIYLRKHAPESPEFEESKLEHPEQVGLPMLQLLKTNRYPLILTFTVVLFFSICHKTFSVFLTGFVPLIGQITKGEMLLLSTIGLFFYMLSLPLFGHFADKTSPRTVMLISAACLGIMAYPFFAYTDFNSLSQVLIMKIVFSLATACFVATLHTWLMDFFSVLERYRLISFIYSLGSQTGSAIPSLALVLWKKTHYIPMPAFFIMAGAALVIPALVYQKKFSIKM